MIAKRMYPEEELLELLMSVSVTRHLKLTEN